MALYVGLLNMPEWYGVALGLNLAARLISYRGYMLYSFMKRKLQDWHLYPDMYYYLISPWPLIKDMSRIESMIVVLFAAANAFCMSFEAPSTAEVASRSGLLATINMIPLLVGTRLSTFADQLGVDLHTSLFIHRWLGVVAMAQAIIHVVLVLMDNKALTWNVSVIYGTIAVSSVLGAGIIVWFCFRRYVYEIILRGHLILSFVASITLWRHLSLQTTRARFYILAGIAGWGFLIVIGCIYFAYRNVAWMEMLPRSQVTDVKGACLVEITLPRRWEVKPGQYLYICIPAVSLTSGLQSHPFTITWWTDTGVGMTVELLICPRRGFTRDVQSHTSHPMITFVSGPHGTSQNFDNFDTVLLFATGSGIAAQIPYLKSLLERFQKLKVRTRRIKLIWEVAHEDHYTWVAEWMNRLIQKDDSFLMKAIVHVPSIVQERRTNFGEKGPVYAGKHEMILMKTGRADLKDYIQQPLEQVGDPKGRMVISVAADTDTRQRIKAVVCEIMDPDVHVLELNYQPPEKLRWI